LFDQVNANEPSQSTEGSHDKHRNFHEIYCAAFVLFDREWRAMNAGAMDFPRVIQSVKGKFDSHILNPYSNIHQLVNENKKNNSNRNGDNNNNKINNNKRGTLTKSVD